MDLERYEAEEKSFELSITRMRGAEGVYDPQVVDALEVMRAGESRDRVIVSTAIRELQSGMVLAEDIYNSSDILMVPRGQEVTVSTLERLKSFHRRVVLKEPVYVYAAQDEDASATDPVSGETLVSSLPR